MKTGDLMKAQPLSQQIVDYVERHLSETISLNAICKSLGYKRSTLWSLFKAETGESIGRFILKIKILKAQEFLRVDGMPISTISKTLGFSSPSHFTRTFKEFTGRLPKEERLRREWLDKKAPFVYVSRTPVSGGRLTLEQVTKKLPSEMLLNLNRYQKEEDRSRFVASRALLSFALNEQGVDVSCETIEKGENGKPFLRSRRIEFNLSHSSDIVCVAIDDSPVGIDVQKKKDLKPNLLRILTDEEKAAVEQSGDSSSLFIKIWSAKEAIAKKSGLGLKKPFASTNLAELAERDAVSIDDNGVTVSVVCFDLGDAWMSIASDIPSDGFLTVPLARCL